MPGGEGEKAAAAGGMRGTPRRSLLGRHPGRVHTMKATIDVTGSWTRVGDAWWVSDQALATLPAPNSETALVAILRKNGDAASILVLDDVVLLYAGQFYGGALFYSVREGEVTVADDITRLVVEGTGSIMRPSPIMSSRRGSTSGRRHLPG